jgi:hypothetical protein
MSWNTTNLEIGLKQVLGLVRDKEFKQAKKRHKRFNPKFTPAKDATSPLRVPQRKGYHQEPLFLFQPPKRKIGAH